VTSYGLIDGDVRIRIVTSDVPKEIQKGRASMTERGIHDTPEPENEVVIWLLKTFSKGLIVIEQDIQLIVSQLVTFLPVVL
jgi:hypothetical protein